MKIVITILSILIISSICQAEEMAWYHLEDWIKYDDALRRKLASDIIKNQEIIDLNWFKEYEKKLNEKCAKYTIHCECGKDFPAIPDERTWRELCMLESWTTTCPHCKIRYDAWYDNDDSGGWTRIEDRFVDTKYQYFSFRCKKSKTYCNDIDCSLHYVPHTDIGKNSCTPELKKEWIRKNK